MVNKTSTDNITPFSQQAEIKEQAGAWLVRIDQGPLSDKEKQQLQNWAATSEQHRYYLNKLANNWDAMNMLQDLAELFPLPEQETTDGTANKKRRANATWFSNLTTWRMPTLFASTVTACALVVLVILNTAPTQQTFTTAVGEQAQYQLQDGTQLSLNTNTQVDIDYTGQRRRITLHQGEVHFEVAKDKTRPFVVYAGDGMVWAVGTAFNVRVDKQAIDVIVTEGTVKVFADIEAEKTEPPLQVDFNETSTDVPGVRESLLKAGQAVQYTQVIGVVAPVASDQLEKKLAWQQGALVFKGETLEQALAEISRYTNKELVIVDPSIKSTRVGGHYKTSDIDNLLLSLSVGFDLEMEYVGDSKILVSGK